MRPKVECLDRGRGAPPAGAAAGVRGDIDANVNVETEAFFERSPRAPVEARPGRRGRHRSWPLAAVVAVASSAAAHPALAQAPDRGAVDSPAWHPTVFAYFLRRAGEEALDPFGATGRREVLQLLMQGSPLQGRFLRVRLDRLGDDGRGKQEGWYEIHGDVIRLYVMDADGAASRIETGRYLHGRICFTDPEDGRVLSYEYLPPAVPDPLPPPPSPGAPVEGACSPAAGTRT